MHTIFQAFIDGLSASFDAEGFERTLSTAAHALDLRCFAYLSLSSVTVEEPRLISTYPSGWTDYYLQKRYERIDPVIVHASATTEPFEWGNDFSTLPFSKPERELFDEAAAFGIRFGFTIPIHDAHGPIAAVTFATDERRPAFQHCIQHNGRVLQLMAMYFHAHARRRLLDRVVDGVRLSPRELESLEWAAKGKSAWEIGQILNISRRTAAFHLDNAKAKLDVRTICQAVARFAATKHPKD
jgi:LuxR family transcriptional regulator, activator of conjugal transfer of Ti plasmids